MHGTLRVRGLNMKISRYDQIFKSIRKIFITKDNNKNHNFNCELSNASYNFFMLRRVTNPRFVTAYNKTFVYNVAKARKSMWKLGKVPMNCKPFSYSNGWLGLLMFKTYF